MTVLPAWLRSGLVALAMSLGLSGCGDSGLQLVSEHRAEQLGLQAWDQMKAEMAAGGDPEAQAVLDRITRRLLNGIGEDPAAWEAVVFDNPSANAFALPGKKIGVFTGLFDVAENEAQLAAVIGHEIGHLQADHGRQRMNAQLKQSLGIRLIFVLLQIGEVDYAREIAGAVGLGLELGVALPYSRRQELEADRIGLDVMAAGGYDPAEAAALWRRMAAQSGARVPGFLATHPAPEDRIEAIEKMLAGGVAG